ncbi:hypothetical protein SUGI_1071420 [Cryptomeria japonica]|nr:hypothetical protein SUGI_1071420 [Cryptomeria japonica]
MEEKMRNYLDQILLQADEAKVLDSMKPLVLFTGYPIKLVLNEVDDLRIKFFDFSSCIEIFSRSTWIHHISQTEMYLATLLPRRCSGKGKGSCSHIRGERRRNGSLKDTKGSRQ